MSPPLYWPNRYESRGDDGVLHSFPTRRSSDPTVGGAAQLALDAGATVIASRSAEHVLARSEEHTSELQSRGHLVCRLLLEKTKASQRQQAAGENGRLLLA